MQKKRLLSAERHQKIIELVAKKESLDFQSLAMELNVSIMTVRRDLKELQEKGYLQLTRGGASTTMSYILEVRAHPRAFDQKMEKTTIGRHAAALIEHGEVIFMGTGSTTMQFAQHLSLDLDLTIITPSLPHASLLANRGFQVISTGGIVLTDDLAQTGIIASDVIKRYFATRAVIGARGVTKKLGITDLHLETAEINNLMTQQSEQVLILADSTKMGVQANFVVSPIQKNFEFVTTPYGLAPLTTELGSGFQIFVARDD